MASGVEIASLILAVLPLVVQLCEDYAKGLETLKNIRGRRWRREMSRYAARLGAEGVIFKNSISRILEDVLSVEVDVTSMETEELRLMLERQEVTEVLEARLGSDRYVYWQNLRLLSDDLVELRQRLRVNQSLGVEFEDELLVARSSSSWKGETVFRETFWNRQLSKFRLMISHSLYDDMLSGVAEANSAFRTMTNDFVHIKSNHQRTTSTQAQCGCYRRARKSAQALWNALIQSSLWNCKDSHSHRVEMSLQDPETGGVGRAENMVRTTLSLTILSYESPYEPVQRHLVGKVVEAVPITSNSKNDAVPEARQIKRLNAVAHRPAVRPSSSSPDMFVHETSQSPSAKLEQKLSDICSELFLSTSNVDVGHAYGFVECGEPRGYRHDLRFLRSLWGDRLTRPLRAATSRNTGFEPTLDTRSLSLWTNKLSVAVSLATSLLIFQGNWLRDAWNLDDFVVVEEALGPEHVSSSARLFLERSFPDCLSCSRDTINTESGGEPRRTLLPLGLALVELVMGQPLTAFRTPEDIGVSERKTDLNVAARLMDYVLLERGFTYHSVVERCLFWDDVDLEDLDDEQVQTNIYENIVQTLLKHLYTIKGYKLDVA